MLQIIITMAAGALGFILARINAVQIRDFDPNREDPQARLAKGQSRAVTREKFERAALTP